MFLDAMDFNSKGEGVVIGDPVNGSMFEAMSVQNGETWYPQLISGMSRNLNKGEAFLQQAVAILNSLVTKTTH